MEERRGQIDLGTVLFLFVTLISIPVHSSAKTLMERWAEDRISQPELTWENFLYSVGDEEVYREVEKWEKFPLSGYDACSAPGVICRDEDIYKMTGACTAVQGLTCSEEGVPLVYHQPTEAIQTDSNSSPNPAAMVAGLVGIAAGSPIGAAAMLPGAANAQREEGAPEKTGETVAPEEEKVTEPPPQAEADKPSSEPDHGPPTTADSPPQTEPEPKPEPLVAEQAPPQSTPPAAPIVDNEPTASPPSSSPSEVPSSFTPLVDSPEVTVPNQVFPESIPPSASTGTDVAVTPTSREDPPPSNRAPTDESVLEEASFTGHGNPGNRSFNGPSKSSQREGDRDDAGMDLSSLRVNPQRPEEVPKHDPTLYKYVRVDDEKETNALARVEKALTQSDPEKVAESLTALIPLLPDQPSDSAGLSKTVVKNIINELSGTKQSAFGFDDEKPRSPQASRAVGDGLREFPDEMFLKKENNNTKPGERSVSRESFPGTVSAQTTKNVVSDSASSSRNRGKKNKVGFAQSDLTVVLLEKTSTEKVNKIARDLAHRIQSHRNQKKKSVERLPAGKKTDGEISGRGPIDGFENKLASVTDGGSSVTAALGGVGGLSLFFIFAWLRKKKKQT